MSGTLAADRQPTAVMKKRVCNASPDWVVTVHSPLASSKLALFTRVPRRMLRRRSNRSATWSRYRRISWWSA